MNALVASMIGLGPHEMSGWDWILATTMTLAWAVLAIAGRPHRDQGDALSGR
ncbi:MAG TPA: hypothetical protein VFT86_06715 [Gaiellaceae bacterium]|nr:hypothetical protein [Gaiellaceae bacterium]